MDTLACMGQVTPVTLTVYSPGSSTLTICQTTYTGLYAQSSGNVTTKCNVQMLHGHNAVCIVCVHMRVMSLMTLLQ